MPKEAPKPTKQQPDNDKTCPVCGVSGFSSVHGLVNHVRRIHGAAAQPTSFPARPSNQPRPADTRPGATAVAAEEPEAGKVSGEAESEPIRCPACESTVSADGATLVRESPRLRALRNSEVALSNLETDNVELRDEIGAIKQDAVDLDENPTLRLELVRIENEKLAERIRAAGKEPVCSPRRSYVHGLYFDNAPAVDLAIADAEEDHQRLAEQAESFGQTGGKSDAEEQPAAERRQARRFALRGLRRSA